MKNQSFKVINIHCKSTKNYIIKYFSILIIFCVSYGKAIAYQSISINEKFISSIDPETYDSESLVVSADETKLCWNASLKKSNIPPIHLFSKSLAIGASVEPVAYSDSPFGSLFTKCAFDVNQNYITNEMKYKIGAMLKSSLGYLLEKEWLPIGFQSVISFYNKTDKLSELDYKDFGISKAAIIEHPRMAPQGRYLAFHTKTDEKDGGIYIYDYITQKTVLLSEFPDKHPTFNSIGDKIFFHGQRIVNGEERAYLGYYILNFDQTRGVSGTRYLIDSSINEQISFIYEKHPSFHEGLDLLFFHGRETPDGPKFIAVRSMKNPQKAYKLIFSLKNEPISKSKSPTVAFNRDSSLYFIGTQKSNKKSFFYKISYEGLQKINEILLK